ncbi:FAD-dependent oxidoreductase [Paenibacillus spongiae]|uniref:FAD-dependent oxidoreductase n=1 Tax=Paenibacillus spongiae TaxID=2909671 RepID=A0ABY5S354_9BACL|nr:FAD-dependent oxidoreductase [Paenibacillus spongiae]UVI27265.1 FAD-dependent oxidoreductase [Paenibacillus spongiae]
MTVERKSETTPKQYDVIVAGGGPSGTMAAIASSRSGAKTLLIERYGFLGGMITNALVGPMQSFHSREEQLVTGIAQEVIDRLVAVGGSPGHVKDMVGFAASITPVDVEKLKYVLQEMCIESSVHVQLHTVVTGVRMDAGSIRSLEMFNKSGASEAEASVYIDCTGDGDVMWLAGVPFEKGRKKDGLAQPMTMMFRMGGVDLTEVRAFMKSHPHEFVLVDGWESCSHVGVSGFFSLVRSARLSGELSVERDRVLFFELPVKGEVSVNMTRVIRYDATDGAALSAAEILSRQQVMEVVRFLNRRIPGFGAAYLINCGTQIGVRESRRIQGKYTLTADDVLSGRTFDDVIARGSYPIDIHSPDSGELDATELNRGSAYDIPYRCLLNDHVHNLLVAGRCISATHEAIASARVSPTAMAIGHAAGAAAALAATSGAAPGDVDVRCIQRLIAQQGGNLGIGHETRIEE